MKKKFEMSKGGYNRFEGVIQLGLILPQKVKMNWHPRNKKYFVSLGYQYTKLGDEFEVNVEHLKDNSKKRVKVNCDYCSKEYTTPFSSYINSINKVVKKVPCTKCKTKKVMECNFINYGVRTIGELEEIIEKKKERSRERYGTDCVLQAEEVKGKIRETNNKKLGCDYPMQSEEVKNKSKKTVEEKYGVDNVSKLPEVREKAMKTIEEIYGTRGIILLPEIIEKKNKTMMERYGGLVATRIEEIIKKTEKTCMERYGVPHHLYSEEVKEKRRKTVRERYGVDHILDLPSVREKARKALEEGGFPASKQQKHLHKILGGKINHKISNSYLDVSFPDEKIYIEYDGSGHNLRIVFGELTEEEFKEKEKKRAFLLRDMGWRMIRILSSKDKLPSDEKIFELVNEAKEYLKEGHFWYEIDIDESMVRCSQFEKKIDLGELRTLKRENKKVTQ